jgi:peroxiredoxin
LKLASLLAVAALVAVNPFDAGDTASRSRHLENDVQNLQSLTRKATEPSPTPVVPGGYAPDFSYETPDHVWRRLQDLLEQGPVLMVIGARDPQLAALERERERLLDLGVIPVAVLDGGARETRTATKRLKLRYTTISDPRSVIAGQFNALSPSTNAPQPCWFVIDRNRRVRALDRMGLPEKGYAAIAIRALALPAPGVALPATR